MKLLSAQIENFASYESLEFNFSDQGLALVSGPTGSGKSTLCDIAPWILFGKTAKGGAVDDILRWPGDKVAKGTLLVEVQGQTLRITRSRGPKSKDNDLYVDDQIRGKDITDTQKIINQKLNLDCELYLSSSYIHEFSSTAAFFITTPKARRTICEQLVDLSLAKKIQTNSSEEKKDLKNKFRETCNNIAFIYKQTQDLQTNINKLLAKGHNFEQQKNQAIERTLDLAINHDKTITNSVKDLLEQNDMIAEAVAALKVQDVCPTCGVDDHRRRDLLAQIQRNGNEIKRLKATKNPYTGQLQAEKARENTYLEQAVDTQDQLDKASIELQTLEARSVLESQQVNDLEVLSDLLVIFRANLVTNTIRSLQDTTNGLLAKHFDSEIQVEFDSTEDVEVSIIKDGNQCVYSQLSKGQRQLLKLCFAVSVMKQVSNHHGISFQQLFLDEALDGLGDAMKLKALGLFQALSLEYNSIFIVDHSETIKPFFMKHFEVELNSGISTIKES